MYTAYWDQCDKLDNTRNLVNVDDGIIAFTWRDNFKLCSSISNASLVTQITTYIILRQYVVTWRLCQYLSIFTGMTDSEEEN